MGKKYLDASAGYTEPVSSGKKHMRGDAQWTAPDASHKFYDAGGEWTAPEMYPPTEFPTETIDTPDKLRQALIAVSQGKRPELYESLNGGYKVGIKIPTSRMTKLEDEDTGQTEITLNASIVGFNDFMPNSMTIAIENHSSGFSCGGSFYNQEINDGIYHIEDRVSGLSTFSYSYNSNKNTVTKVKVPSALSTPKGIYDNILQPYYSDWEKTVFTQAKNSGWKQYFRKFPMSYGMLDANVSNMTVAPKSGVMRVSAPSSMSLSERTVESYFHVGDPSDSYTLAEMGSVTDSAESGTSADEKSNVLDFSKACRNEMYKNIVYHEYAKKQTAKDYANVYINDDTGKPYGWQYIVDNQLYYLAEEYYTGGYYFNRYLIHVVQSNGNNMLTSIATDFHTPYYMDILEYNYRPDTYGMYSVCNCEVLAVVAL